MAKKFAMWFGWLLVVLGVLGFFSNPIVGASGWLMADTAHNVVHIILGAVLIWAASAGKSHSALKWIGILFLVLAVLGWFSSTGSVLGLVAANEADNWFHLVLGVLFVWAGWAKSSSSMAMGAM